MTAPAFVGRSVVERVEKEYGYFTANRFKYYYDLLASLKGATLTKKLVEVNDFWNGTPYGSDLNVWGLRDYWATPYEFLIKNPGDCEDYVIAKYFTLTRLGIDPSKLFFVYARVRGYRSSHMVLAYYPKGMRYEPLILDSLNLKIFPASKRKDLTPIYTFNGELLQRYGSGKSRGLGNKSRKVKRKWEDLMQRMKRYPI